MLLIKVLFMKKACHRSLFLCLSGISHGQYCRKILAKSGGLKYKEGGMAICAQGGLKPSAHYLSFTIVKK